MKIPREKVLPSIVRECLPLPSEFITGLTVVLRHHLQTWDFVDVRGLWNGTLVAFMRRRDRRDVACRVGTGAFRQVTMLLHKRCAQLTICTPCEVNQ